MWGSNSNYNLGLGDNTGRNNPEIVEQFRQADRYTYLRYFFNLHLKDFNVTRSVDSLLFFILVIRLFATALGGKTCPFGRWHCKSSTAHSFPGKRISVN
jgi:hypothetical protein